MLVDVNADLAKSSKHDCDACTCVEMLQHTAPGNMVCRVLRLTASCWSLPVPSSFPTCVVMSQDLGSNVRNTHFLQNDISYHQVG